MSEPKSDADEQRYWPLGQIILARVREFYREPEAIFWVYGFPALMVVALGIAFRNQPAERVLVDVVDGPSQKAVLSALGQHPDIQAAGREDDEARRRLRLGKTHLVIVPIQPIQFVYDPARPESILARRRADDALQEHAGRVDPLAVKDERFEEVGGRYIDFLVPGLLGMGLMGGGLWGVGYVTVDMRIRKLLKRFLATPMRRSDFLAGILLSRLLFTIPEVGGLLLFAWLAFGVVNQGSWGALLFLIILGEVAFAGLGLLIASRAKTIEAISGLMNLIMMPMWILSGIFFSVERFPEMFQPAIHLLPLTTLLEALRAVMMEGASLWSQSIRVAILFGWGLGSYLLALRIFRWT